MTTMNLNEYKELVGRIPFGKRLATALYVHREGLAAFGKSLAEVVEQLAARFEVSAEYNLVKFRTDELKVSFLSYPEFFSEAHPSLRHALSVDLVTESVRRSDYTENINPPILHRKEQMLPLDHPKRAQFATLTEAEEAEGLYAETSTIGFRLNWERLLSKKGLSIEGHVLRRIEGDWVEPGAEQGSPVIERHRTALRRYELSKPIKCLMESGLLKPGKSFFDYGCGLGSDIAGLQSLGF
jgi:DNA phosphorothioation-associated putative methyltransferase